MNTLVTGSAGFIGAQTCIALMQQGHDVVGLDNLNDYYDVALKHARLERIQAAAHSSPGSFTFKHLDLAGAENIAELFSSSGFDRVVHLAAQAGVRYSLENPSSYVQSNLVGFLHILEGCRHQGVGHLVYASSSSVYGANRSLPFSETDNVDHPLSLYAASKKANEGMAHSYAHLYGLPCTGLRFFTVYGPWGRPDMAPIKFARAILAGEPIQVFNQGRHSRDFTYIDDIVEGVIRVLDHPAEPNADWSGRHPEPHSSLAPWRIYNIGNSQPIELADFIAELERALGRSAEKILMPLQPGDVEDTFADVSALEHAVAYRPGTSLQAGVRQFVDWYQSYYR